MHLLHLIDSEGNKVAIDSSEANSEKYAGYDVDLQWYKDHGYVEARKFFRSLEEKYKDLTSEQAQELLASY